MAALIRFFIWVAIIFGAIGAIAYYGWIDVWTVPTDDPQLLAGIQPTLGGGDVVLVSRHGAPSLGQLARCTDPDEPRRWVVGRIAAGGEALHLTGQSFSTSGSRPKSAGRCPNMKLTNPSNGIEVDLECRTQDFAGNEYEVLTNPDPEGPAEDQTIDVPQNNVYLVSDDRYLHLDSRDFGTVPESSCQHVLFRLWGAQGFGDSSRRFDVIW